MPACTRRACAGFTDFFSSDDIEATARRTGFVTRASQIPGTLVLALITVGSWRDAHTTVAPGATHVTQVVAQVAVSPEAIQQRRHKRALVFLQEMIRHALAHVQALEHVCADALLPALRHGYLAARTGLGLPDSWMELLPGSGGRATQAGANMHAVWDDKSSVLSQGALTPWNVPEQQYVDPVVA